MSRNSASISKNWNDDNKRTRGSEVMSDGSEMPEDAAAGTGNVQDDDDFVVAATVMEKIKEIVFSVMFFMVHGNSSWPAFEYGSMLIEDLQLVTFFISPDLMDAYTIPYNLAYSQMEYQTMDLNQFNIWFILCVCAVFVLILNIIWVAYGFLSGQHKFIWPIWTLRFSAMVLPTVLYLPILEIIVNPITCNRILDTEVHHSRRSDIFALEYIPCNSPLRLPQLIVAVIALVVYIPTCISFAAVFFDTKPTCKEPSNRVHGRLDIIYACVKTCLIFVYKFLPHQQDLARVVSATLGCVIMFLTTVTYFPYYNPFINQMRAGLFFGASVVGVVGTIATAIHAATGVQGSILYIYIMAGGYPLGILMGFVISGLILKSIERGVRRRLKKLQSGEGVDDFSQPELLVFHSWVQVEIAARFSTVHMDHRRQRINFAVIPEVQAIFKRGIEEFPDQPLLRLSYALYMFHLKSMTRDATHQLSKIDQLNPPLDVKFQIYYTNQIATTVKETDFLGEGVKLDITSYAEYQKTDKDAKLNHFLAVQDMRAMWELLLDKSYSLEELSAVSNRLYANAQKAEAAYLKLISKFPKSKTTLRFFARFCFDVKNDPIRGSALIEKANDLELENESGSEVDENDKTSAKKGPSNANSQADLPMLLSSKSGLSRKSTSQSQGQLEIKKSKGPGSIASSHASSASAQKRAQVALQQQRATKLRAKSLAIQILILVSTTIALTIIGTNFGIALSILQESSRGLSTMFDIHM
ncbi:hypothetical protein HDU99_009150, partial [Rhizoclosmatium hyalinum]